MLHLNVINLIQAGSITVAVLGITLLWGTPKFRGVAMLLILIAAASLVNILEESGVTRDIYLLSPVFLILVGPVTYLAALKLTNRSIKPLGWLHLAPAIIALGFTHYVQVIIGLGSLIRVVYAVLTGVLLLRYKQQLDEQRSDSAELSLNWLVGLIVTMTLVNFVDLIRLNLQMAISSDLNLLGQGVNNFAWLIATMYLIVKLVGSSGSSMTLPVIEKSNSESEKREDFEPLFLQLDSDIRSNDWFRQPRLTLNDLSAMSGLQTRDISRAINLSAQCSFNEYINTLRVDYVCKTIEQQPALSMTRISADAGFTSKASFNQIFKKQIGETPSQFKARVHS